MRRLLTIALLILSTLPGHSVPCIVTMYPSETGTLYSWMGKDGIVYVADNSSYDWMWDQSGCGN